MPKQHFLTIAALLAIATGCASDSKIPEGLGAVPSTIGYERWRHRDGEAERTAFIANRDRCLRRSKARTKNSRDTGIRQDTFYDCMLEQGWSLE